MITAWEILARLIVGGSCIVLGAWLVYAFIVGKFRK